MESKDKTALIKYRLEQAKIAAENAELLINHKAFNAAVNRIYYSIFNSINALALKYEFKTSKHQQLIGWFNKTFIKEGKIDAKYGKILKKAYEARSESDYGEFVDITMEEARDLFEDMKDFLTIIGQFI